MLVSIVLAALPFLSAVASQSFPANCTRNATVVAGDTCDSISAQYGASTFQLALVNEATIDENCDNLVPGETICLGIEGYDCTEYYKVVANDTCDLIEEMYGMDNSTLYLNNPQIDPGCSNIYIGEVLCVSTTPMSYPAYNETLYEMVAETYLPWCS